MSKKSKRRKEQKAHDPVYNIKESNIRAYINSLLRTDPDVQKAMQEEARKLYLSEAGKESLDVTTLVLFSLHRSERYGRKRLLKFASTFKELREYYEGRYEDCDLFAMRVHLKEETGIDLENLDEEIERYVKENPDEG